MIQSFKIIPRTTKERIELIAQEKKKMQLAYRQMQKVTFGRQRRPRNG